jgi:hypothetical protein
MPAKLPISCDLRRFVQLENGRYHCALGRSKAHHRIRAHVALNPRAPEAVRPGAVYEAVYAYPNGPAVRFDVSAGIDAGYGPRKDRRLPAADMEPALRQMVWPIVQHVAALTERAQILHPIVGRVERAC